MSLLSRSPLDVTNAMWNAESFAGEQLHIGTLKDYDPDAFVSWHFVSWTATNDQEQIKGGSTKGFHVEPAAGYKIVMRVDPLPSDIGQVPFGPDGQITLKEGDKLTLNRCPDNKCTMKFYYQAKDQDEIETAASNVEHTVDLISVTKDTSNGSTNGTDDEEEEEEGLTCTDPNSEPNVDGTECVCKSGFALDEDEDSDTLGTCIESGMGTGTKLAIALGGVVLLGGGIWYAVKQ